MTAVISRIDWLSARRAKALLISQWNTYFTACVERAMWRWTRAGQSMAFSLLWGWTEGGRRIDPQTAVHWITWRTVGMFHSPSKKFDNSVQFLWWSQLMDVWWNEEEMEGVMSTSEAITASLKDILLDPLTRLWRLTLTHVPVLQIPVLFFSNLSCSQTMPRSLCNPRLNKRLMQIKVAFISLRAGSREG